MARLRRLLPTGIEIVTTPEGYRLHADRAAVDVTAYTDHLAAGAAVADAHLRLARLEAAQRLWRGRPYAELDHPCMHPEVARLSELRAGATEQYGAALLAVGRTAEAVAALEALTVAEPLREAGVALLMRAIVAAAARATRWPCSLACAPGWPRNWAWIRRPSCGRWSSRCCGRRSPSRS